MPNSLLVLALIIAVLAGRGIEYFDRAIPGIGWHWGPYHSRILMLAGIGVIMSVSLQLINGVSGQFSLGHAGFMGVGAYLAGYAGNTYGSLDPDDSATAFQNVGPVAWYFFSLAVVVALIAAVLTGLFVVLRSSQKLHRALPLVLMLGVVAWFTWDFSAAFNLDDPPARFVWTKLVRGLGVLYQWVLGHGMPCASGMSSKLPPWSRRPLCFLVLLGGGGIFAAAAGLLVGLPTLRLRGDYLAIATLGFAEILRVVFNNSAALGRATGLSVTPYWNTADPDRDPVTHYILPWILAATVVTVAAVWRVAYSPKGQLIRAVREDEIAAAAVGINTTRQKIAAFVVGAFFAGVGGALYVHRDGYINPESFGIDKSLLYVVMVTLGGLGSISGAVVAGVLLTVLDFLLRQLASVKSLPPILQKVAANQLALFALALVVMMLVRPKGLLGNRELWPRRRAKLATAPATGGV